MAMTRQQAWDLLTEYNHEPFHLRHAVTVEHVMGWYAQELGYGDERDFSSMSATLLEGRIRAAAPMRPVSSSAA